MVQIELLLASALGTDGCFCTPTYVRSHVCLSDILRTTFDGTLPPHFYGELVKTREGCQLLAASGHFAEFANYIRNFGLEEEEGEIIAGLKSALWAVVRSLCVKNTADESAGPDRSVQGRPGLSRRGMDRAEHRGDCGGLARVLAPRVRPSLSGGELTQEQDGLLRAGADLVHHRGSRDLGGARVGECVDPVGSASRDLRALCDLQLCRRTSMLPRLLELTPGQTPLWDPPPYTVPSALSLAAPSSSLEREALTAFSNLSNHILSTAASKSLARLKVRHPELFSSPALYYRVMEMLGSSHYRLLVRRYVVELFDLALDRAAVKGIMDAGEAMRVHSRETEGNEGEEVERGGAGTGSKMHGSLLEPHKDDGMGGEEVSIPLKHLVPLVVSHGFAL